MESARRANSQADWCCAGAIHPVGGRTGATSTTSTQSPMCKSACRRVPSQAGPKWA